MFNLHPSPSSPHEINDIFISKFHLQRTVTKELLKDPVFPSPVYFLRYYKGRVLCTLLLKGIINWWLTHDTQSGHCRMTSSSNSFSTCSQKMFSTLVSFAVRCYQSQFCFVFVLSTNQAKNCNDSWLLKLLHQFQNLWEAQPCQ